MFEFKINNKNGVSLGRYACSVKTVFSIFYRGCKLPKSIHICISGCKVTEKKGEFDALSVVIYIFIRDRKRF